MRISPLLVDALGDTYRIRIVGQALKKCGDDGGERNIVASSPKPGFEMRLLRDGEGDVASGHENSSFDSALMGENYLQICGGLEVEWFEDDARGARKRRASFVTGNGGAVEIEGLYPLIAIEPR